MKIAIPLAGGKLCAHFGHCEQFALVEADPTTKQISNTVLATPPPHAPGVLPRWLSRQGVNAVIAGGMGQRAQLLFAENKIGIRTGTPGGTPEELVKAFLDSSLPSGAAACQHGGCH